MTRRQPARSHLLYSVGLSQHPHPDQTLEPSHSTRPQRQQRSQRCPGILLGIALLSLGLLLPACATDRAVSPESPTPTVAPNIQPNTQPTTQPNTQPTPAKSLRLSSAAFSPEGSIPPKYTCKGENASPPLSWQAAPAGAQSWVLLAEAVGKVDSNKVAEEKPMSHWVLYDLPAEVQQLPEALPAQPLLLEGGTHGKNDRGQFGYLGFCPTPTPQRYVFRLYALDRFLDLPPGATASTVQQAIAGHVLGSAELIVQSSPP